MTRGNDCPLLQIAVTSISYLRLSQLFLKSDGNGSKWNVGILNLYNNGERVRMFVCVLLIFSVGSRTGRKLIFGMLGALTL